MPSAFLKKYAISYVEVDGRREQGAVRRSGMKGGRKAEKNSLWPSPAVDLSLSRSVDGRRRRRLPSAAALQIDRVSASSAAAAAPSTKKGVYAETTVAAAASASGQTDAAQTAEAGVAAAPRKN